MSCYKSPFGVFLTRFARMLNTAEYSGDVCTVGDTLSFLSMSDSVRTDETLEQEWLLNDLLLKSLFHSHT